LWQVLLQYSIITLISGILFCVSSSEDADLAQGSFIEFLLKRSADSAHVSRQSKRREENAPTTLTLRLPLPNFAVIVMHRPISPTNPTFPNHSSFSSSKSISFAACDHPIHRPRIRICVSSATLVLIDVIATY